MGTVVKFPGRDSVEDAATEIVRIIAKAHVAAGLRPSHALRRVNPKGEPFIGQCVICGRSGLTAAEAHNECKGYYVGPKGR